MLKKAVELEPFVQALEAEIHRLEGPDATSLPVARTVRYYQSEGLLTPPEREGRVPLYGERQMLEVLAVRTLQRAGVALKEIRSQLSQANQERLTQIAKSRGQVKDLIGTTLNLNAVSATDRAAELKRVMGRLGVENVKGRPLYLPMLRLSIIPKRCHLLIGTAELRGMTDERARDIAYAVYASLLQPEIERGAGKGRNKGGAENED